MFIEEDVDIDEIIQEYGLACHVKELDEVGLTVVDKEILRLSGAWVDRLRDAILRVAETRAEARFELDKNPAKAFAGRPSEIGHMIFSHLIYEDRIFIDVLTHPVKKALMSHLLGAGHRIAVSDGWVKWQTPETWPSDETTGFHADQSVVPPPWNWRSPHIANMNWTLTDYSREDGALAYVPGSHREERLPELGEALPLAIPVEAAKGSLVIFNGALWHGSYRKTTPGLRVTMIGQHCRPYMLPFQDFKGQIAEEIIASSEDPSYLRSLLREDEVQLRSAPGVF